jgi:hypothetical protein
LSIGLRDPIPDDLAGLFERASHEAKSMTNGAPGSVDNVQREANLQVCLAKIQAITTQDLGKATERTSSTTERLARATWAMFWVSAALAIGNVALAIATFVAAGK